MHIKPLLGKFASEVARAIRNFKYEVSERGLHLQGSSAVIGGVFRNAYAPAGHGFGALEADHNRVVNQGLNYILNAALGGDTPVGAFYLAPFAGNVSPANSWTGANFTANATEFTAYTAGSRLPWTTATSTAQSIGNSNDIVDSTMTLSSGGPYNVYGVGLLQASAKSATTGVLVAATRFANPRTNMAEGDRLALEYVIAATDEADA